MINGKSSSGYCESTEACAWRFSTGPNEISNVKAIDFASHT
jgi:hypothetical protein